MKTGWEVMKIIINVCITLRSALCFLNLEIYFPLVVMRAGQIFKSLVAY